MDSDDLEKIEEPEQEEMKIEIPSSLGYSIEKLESVNEDDYFKNTKLSLDLDDDSTKEEEVPEDEEEEVEETEEVEEESDEPTEKEKAIAAEKDAALEERVKEKGLDPDEEDEDDIEQAIELKEVDDKIQKEIEEEEEKKKAELEESMEKVDLSYNKDLRTLRDIENYLKSR